MQPRERIHLADAEGVRWRTRSGEMFRALRLAPPLAAMELRRRLRARFRGARLGWLWALAPALVVTLWATLAARARVLGSLDESIPYPLFALWGLVLWQSLSESLTLQVEGLATERTLLAAALLPAEVLILSRAGEAAFAAAVKLLVATAACGVFGFLPPATALASPLATLPLIALGSALGIALAPFHALQRGVGRLLPAALLLWFVVTPVLFRTPTSGVLGRIMRLNPASPLLDGARDLALAGALRDPWAYAGASALAFAALLPAWVLYRLALPILHERATA